MTKAPRVLRLDELPEIGHADRYRDATFPHHTRTYQPKTTATIN
ncbi:hypothetical protein [Streptomyces bluensis]